MRSPDGAVQIYTIGHSNHPLEVLVDWLSTHGILQLVDIRRHPGSRRLPQFNQGTLRRGLSAAGIAYCWYGESLGGMRQYPPATGGFAALPATGLRAFAMHMNTPVFRKALDECLQLAVSNPTAFMCAERDPSRCHRQLISDYLALKGYEVMHITGINSVARHKPNPVARLESEKIYYDRGTQAGLGL